MADVRLLADDWPEAFFEEDVSSLGGADDATDSEATAEQIEKDLKKEELDEAKNKNAFRKKFFYWAMTIITASIVVNAAGMAAYVVSQWGRLADPVMIGWFATTVIEVLGIGYIIANYLFNGNGLSGSRRNAPPPAEA